MSGADRKNHKIVTGLHIVKKRLARGDRYYIYAWRNGPRIHTHDGGYPVITPNILHKQHVAIEKQNGAKSGPVLNHVIDEYRASPEFNHLRPSTQGDYRLWLNRISGRFGDTPLAVFDDRRMRSDIMKWRDLWSDQPRTADKASVMFSTLLGWAMERGKVKLNIAAKIKHLHRVNKSDEVWEPEHWKAFRANDPPAHLMDALVLASLTGLRLSDLVAVKWSQVYPTAIKIENTQKRGGRAVIPIVPELSAWLDAQTNNEGTLLKNSRGFPWSSSGLGCVFQRKKPPKFDRTIHDLRGTFATRLILAGLTDEQAALVLGWTAKRISSIRARYVDEERVILSLAEKLRA